MSSIPPTFNQASVPKSSIHGVQSSNIHSVAEFPPISNSTVDFHTTVSNASKQPKTTNAGGIRPANNKRPLMTTTKDGKQLSEKKLRRLEKNRLSARECRRRKREATENMLHEINVLEGENLRLRLQLRIGREAEESLGKEQIRVTEEINKLLQSGASESEIYATIEDFKEKFADYGRDRRSAIEFHFQNIERLLMPTQTTTVAMRALGSSAVAGSSIDGENSAAVQNPSITKSQCKSDSTDLDTSRLQEAKKLFGYLVNYLKVTPEQAAALKDSRWVARDLDESLAKSLNVVKELRARLHQAGEKLETEFDNVRAILTPTQAAKFLVWVANNRACIHMLNELWNRVYTDAAIDEDEEEKIKEF